MSGGALLSLRRIKTAIQPQFSIMKLQTQQIIHARKTNHGKRRVSVNDILRESYRRFAKDKYTRRAADLFL